MCCYINCETLFQSVHFKWQNDKTHLLVVLHLSLALRLPHHFLHSINHNGHTWRPLVLCSIPVLNLSEARFVLTVSEVRKSKWQNAWNQRIDLQKTLVNIIHGSWNIWRWLHKLTKLHTGNFIQEAQTQFCSLLLKFPAGMVVVVVDSVLLICPELRKQSVSKSHLSFSKHSSSTGPRTK